MKRNGRPIPADVTCRGRTEIGKEIDGVFVPSNGLTGRLFVDAIVTGGGSYSGYLRVEEY
ncbi:MAG: hypothetical protein KUG76_06010 [Gammaproteobacteria bacterium]|nr:hypothetical protein [Gammaproteobacteria bacterium]